MSDQGPAPGGAEGRRAFHVELLRAMSSGEREIARSYDETRPDVAQDHDVAADALDAGATALAECGRLARALREAEAALAQAHAALREALELMLAPVPDGESWADFLVRREANARDVLSRLAATPPAQEPQP